MKVDKAFHTSTRLARALLFVLLVLAVGRSVHGKTVAVFVPDATPEGQQHYMEVIKPAFEAENPGVTVEFQFVTWTDYLDRLLVMVTSNNAPDVLQVGGEFVGTLVLNGLIQPLDSYLVDWPHLDEYALAAVLDGQVEGEQYTVPYRLDVRTLIYRKDFFEEAGLNADRPPTNWDELLDYAKKLVQHDPDRNMTRAGFHVVPAVHEALAFILQGGARLVDDTGTQAAFNSPAGVDAVQFMADMVLEHGVGLPEGGPHGPGGNPTAAGTAAMENSGDYVVGQMMLLRDDHDVLGVALPTTGLEQRSVLNVNKWAVSSFTQDADLAWRFIAFVSRPEVLADISRVNSFMPARGTLYREAPWVDDPRWFTFYEAAELAVPMPGHAFNLGQVFVHLREALLESFAGARPVNEALNEAARQSTHRLMGL